MRPFPQGRQTDDLRVLDCREGSEPTLLNTRTHPASSDGDTVALPVGDELPTLPAGVRISRPAAETSVSFAERGKQALRHFRDQVASLRGGRSK